MKASLLQNHPANAATGAMARNISAISMVSSICFSLSGGRIAYAEESRNAA